MLVCGDCFLAGEDEDEKLHLRIIATPPTATGEVIVVSVTTRLARSESLLVLKPTDHPFLRHESVIAFRYSEITTVAKIESIISSGKAKGREPIGQELLKRIQTALLESDFTPNGVRHLAKEVLDR